MGAGDWNDGFNAMGEGAESVWLTFFASIVCEKLAPLCPDASLSTRIRRAGETLGRAADAAWEEDRYLRGWYGDGAPLGSRKGENCRIDSLSQSFAAFCPWADRRRVRTAIDTALRELWDRERHLLRLYAPAVEPGERSPGYVSSYGPGFRENGGQYTHGAVWLARACFAIGRWSDGAAILRDLALSVRPEEAGGEPWLLAADVACAPGQEGRAGWTGYTGAAGWWWRTAWENMLGLAMEGGHIALRLPPAAREAGWTAQIGNNS
jgi:cellobiose phosphorylase